MEKEKVLLTSIFSPYFVLNQMQYLSFNSFPQNLDLKRPGEDT